MATFTIPLKQVPSQRVSVVLAGQPCLVEIRYMRGRQYFSLSLNGTVICTNVLMVNRSLIVRAPYTGLIGDFFVIDTVGDAAPEYTGWGDRWLLAYSDDV